MNKVKLGEVLEIKRGTSLSGKYYSENGEIIRLTLGNFNYPGGGFKENTSKKDIYFTGNVAPEYILHKGDIITPLTEQVAGLLGETARIPNDNLYVQSGDIGLVLPKENVLNKSYAYYLISSPSIRKQLGAAAQQTKIRHTSPDKIKSCEAWIPDLRQQSNIGKLLDSINFKIALNNKINSNLEAIAKKIYDYWFVQFDFPDENGKPYKASGGKMVWNEKLRIYTPVGWNTKSLEGIISFDRGISYTSKDISSNTGIPMINLASIDVNRNYRPGEIKWFSGKYLSKKIVVHGDMLIACTDLTQNAEIIGSPIIVPKEYDKYLYSMDLAKVNILTSDLSDLYLYMTLRTDYYHRYIKYFASGTNVLHLNLDGIYWYPVLIPPHELQNKYVTTIRPIINKKTEIINENKELIHLKDWLLPMLMNGQVTVN